MTRRLVAIGGFVIVLIAMVLLLKSCVDTQRRNGLKDFNTQVNELGSQSVSNVSQGLEIMANKDLDPLAQRNQLSDLAADSDAITQRARELSSPGGLDGATWNLATALSLRATALDRISQLIGKARGTTKAEQEAATQQIAGQMQAFLASDVLWQLRVTPFIRERFQAEDLNSESIASSTVAKDAAWINPGTVANRIGGLSEEPDEAAEVAPGTHGHGIASVEAGGKTLTPGAVNNVPVGSGLSFSVTIENQGENDERDVTVSVTGTKQGGGTKIDETKKVPSSPKGTKTPVEVPITASVSGSYSITVEVRPVPGEKNTDNNKQRYNVIFQ
ncbi:MAG: hypothetical protein JHD16_03800 [Solirubrobacteraceae bacterium]|nr:hypothetical protein [Solirubrobacteraceae bacterium]